MARITRLEKALQVWEDFMFFMRISAEHAKKHGMESFVTVTGAVKNYSHFRSFVVSFGSRYGFAANPCHCQL